MKKYPDSGKFKVIGAHRMCAYSYLWPLVATIIGFLLTSCASLPEAYDREPSYAIPSSTDTRLGKTFSPTVEQHPEVSGFYPLSQGMDAFAARIGLIDLADKTLDIQYYIWHLDTTGMLLIDRVLKAADRGVRVRLLLDDLDTAGRDIGLKAVDAHPNIEIRLFNPFAHRGNRLLGFLTDGKRLNRRMHNKSITADNTITIVGGRNIGNEYFGAVSHAEFSDLDVLALGPIVSSTSNMFDQYWNSATVYPVTAIDNNGLSKPEMEQTITNIKKEADKLRDSEYIQALLQSDVRERMRTTNLKFYWGRAKLLYDDPNKVNLETLSEDTHLALDLLNYINKAKREVVIVSPYFVPGRKLVEYLGVLVKRGVRVQILTNSLSANDVGLVHAGYMRYRVDLLRHGVELYEFKSKYAQPTEVHEKRWSGSSNASLHAKAFGLDRRVLFVGSFNLDPRSVALNTEMGALFESPELAELLYDDFKENLKTKAYQVKLVTIPENKSYSGFEEYALKWETIENGEQVQFEKEPNTSMWQRFLSGFLSMIVIERML